MNMNNIEIINEHIRKTTKYILYCESLIRIIYAANNQGYPYTINTGHINLLTEILFSYIKYLHICISNMSTDWELCKNKKDNIQ